jgi:xylulokinase
MSVILSAASCLDWVTYLTGFANVPALLTAIEQAPPSVTPLYFLPYLSGERTPHNDPQATGMFWGLTHQHGPIDLGLAVLEGVGFALADGMDVLHATGLRPTSITLIGGGARSAYWRQMLADISGQVLEYRTGGDVGPAMGAARLAQIAMHPERPLRDLLPELPLEQRHVPDPARHAEYTLRRQYFQAMYQVVKKMTQ